jgi:NitT/TauT family transport system permease protein
MDENMRKIITPSNILFLALLVLFLIPLENGKIYWFLAGVTTGLKAVQILMRIFLKSEDNKRSTDDFMVVLFLVFGLWHFFSTRVVLLSKLLFPEPDAVLGMLFSDFFELVTFHLVHSVILLLSGYVLALAVAIPLGIIIATHGRFLRLADPYIKLLGPIPPLVYIPYLIATLPTFYSASVAVIFLAAFWPILANTIHGVLNIPRNLIDSAKVLNLKGPILLFRVILPGAMPSICNGANLSLLFSFIMLVAAELIGSSVGVGWYIRHFGMFGDYKRVLTGMIFFGVIITLITWGTSRIERHLLKWTDTVK